MTRLKTISIARASVEMGHTIQEMTHGSKPLASHVHQWKWVIPAMK